MLIVVEGYMSVFIYNATRKVHNKSLISLLGWIVAQLHGMVGLVVLGLGHVSGLGLARCSEVSNHVGGLVVPPTGTRTKNGLVTIILAFPG